MYSRRLQGRTCYVGYIYRPLLAGKVKQSAVTVCLFVRLFSLHVLNPLTFDVEFLYVTLFRLELKVRVVGKVKVNG